MRLLPAHVDLVPPRRWTIGVPIASTLAGSAVAALPFVLSAPLLPSFGLLMLLSWRLLRPEMWAAWIALPLGLADDLLTGNALGSAAALWTATLLVLDRLDGVMVWRDHWADWAIAAIAIQCCAIGEWLLSGFVGGQGSFAALAPQVIAALLCYPAAVRITASLDRWRLRR
ncbi:rod shape-determining protein MreD [Sphingomonas naphthae]|uniref:Rod shape-determining protein MreD n=1 Tax=Sphingomonas naphthae TaxID=1813468 RepID=A0ABY7TJE6_9SPHN|nr:rod shape-determining protein MreD [Sphingomonas naphthae]WCT73325.1 rod shape-determining protein MreD [Sphingomonas naphthae]